MVRKRPIRRSQLICPFGVGAIVDFRGPESLMTAGLDAWPQAREAPDQCSDLVVLEERLQARLRKSHFRLPPAYDEDEGGTDQLVPFVRFPSWNYCPDCGRMRAMSLYEGRAKCNSDRCLRRPEKFRPWLIPVRIITVCEQGHVDDFPFHTWVHQGVVQNVSEHILTWKATGSSASLSGITIACSCEASRTLQGAFTFSSTEGGALHDLGVDCSGRRPWLGQQGIPNACGSFIRVVQRGATNVYFPVIKTSIYLPMSVNDQDEWLQKCVDEVIRKVADKGEDEIERFARAKAYVHNIKEDLLLRAVRQRLDRDRVRNAVQNMTEEEFRYEEFRVLRGEDLNPGKELKLKEYAIETYAGLAEFFSRIRLVTKLRETRVLESFTRVTPLDNGQSAPQELALDPALDWLPAVIVRGEGIFFEFRNELFDDWERTVANRITHFRDSYTSSLRRLDALVSRLGARFVLLHTFAHLMIRELTFECGYGSAALRERIYCDINGEPMNGVLLYTASGDSEGTMGGLVRQGRPDRLLRCFASALNKAIWCSGDPVCIESTGQGTNNSNLAACHGCALLPETCCECGNMLLDRALIVGRPKERELGFFARFIEGRSDEPEGASV